MAGLPDFSMLGAENPGVTEPVPRRALGPDEQLALKPPATSPPEDISQPAVAPQMPPTVPPGPPATLKAPEAIADFSALPTLDDAQPKPWTPPKGAPTFGPSYQAPGSEERASLLYDVFGAKLGTGNIEAQRLAVAKRAGVPTTVISDELLTKLAPQLLGPASNPLEQMKKYDLEHPEVINQLQHASSEEKAKLISSRVDHSIFAGLNKALGGFAGWVAETSRVPQAFSWLTYKITSGYSGVAGLAGWDDGLKNMAMFDKMAQDAADDFVSGKSAVKNYEFMLKGVSEAKSAGKPALDEKGNQQFLQSKEYDHESNLPLSVQEYNRIRKLDEGHSLRVDAWLAEERGDTQAAAEIGAEAHNIILSNSAPLAKDGQPIEGVSRLAVDTAAGAGPMVVQGIAANAVVGLAAKGLTAAGERVASKSPVAGVGLAIGGQLMSVFQKSGLPTVMQAVYTYEAMKPAMGRWLDQMEGMQVPPGKDPAVFKSEMLALGIISSGLEAAVMAHTVPQIAGTSGFLKGEFAKRYAEAMKSPGLRKAIEQMGAAMRHSGTVMSQQGAMNAAIAIGRDYATGLALSGKDLHNYESGKVAGEHIGQVTLAAAHGYASGVMLGAAVSAPSAIHMRFQAGLQQLRDQKALNHSQVVADMYNLTPEHATQLAENAPLSRALADKVQNKSGVDTRSIFVDAQAMDRKVDAMKGDIDKLLGDLNIDKDDFANAHAIGGRINIKLADYLRVFIGGEHIELGKSLLDHTSASNTEATLAETKRQAALDDAFANFAKNRKDLSVRWEMANTELDNFAHSLSILEFTRDDGTIIKFDSKGVKTARDVLERQIQIYIGKNWHADPAELAKSAVPIVADETLKGAGTKRSWESIRQDRAADVSVAPSLTDRAVQAVKDVVKPPTEAEIARREDVAAIKQGSQYFGKWSAWQSRVEKTFAEMLVRDNTNSVVRDSAGKLVLGDLTNRSIIAFLDGTGQYGRSANTAIIFHELAHANFFLLHELSSLKTAPADLKAVFDSALKFSGWTSVDDWKSARKQYEEDFFALDKWREENWPTLGNEALTTQEAARKMPAELKEAFARFDEFYRKQEVFSEAYEVYITSGKSPSPKLAAAFQYMEIAAKGWMDAHISGDVVSQFPTGLPPGFTAMFDAMHATKRELEHQVVFSENHLLFRTPSELGISVAAWLKNNEQRTIQLSELAQNVQARVLERLKTTVLSQMEAFARVRKTEILKSGRWKDGLKDHDEVLWNVFFEKDTAFEVDPRTIIDIFGEEVGARVNAHLKKIGKLSPSSDMSKDASTKIILEHLIDGYGIAGGYITRTVGEIVAIGVDKFPAHVAEMKANTEAKRNFSPMVEEVAGRQAILDEIIKQDSMTQLSLERELGVLTSINGAEKGLPSIMKQIKEAAKEKANRSSLNELRAGDLRRKFEKFSRIAVEAAANGDFALAQMAYQRKMTYFFAEREALKLREEAKKADNFAIDASSQRSMLRIGEGGPVYVEAARTVLAALGHLEDTNIAGRPAHPIIAEIARMIEGSGTMELLFDADRVNALLTEMFTNPTKKDNLTVAEREMLDVTLRQIKAASSYWVRAEGKQHQMALKEFAQSVAVDVANFRKQPGVLIGKPNSFWESIKGSAKRAKSTLLDMAYLTQRLGPHFQEAFWQRFKDAQETDQKLSELVVGKALAMLQELPDAAKGGLHETNVDWSDLPMNTGAQRTKLLDRRDRGTMIALALQGGNPGNLHLTLNGYGWSYRQYITFLEKNLTRAEALFVQRTWDFMDEQVYPLIREHYQKVNGVDPKKVEATPMVLRLKNGGEVTLRGGYYPMKTMQDPALSDLGARVEVKTLRDVYRQNDFAGTTVSKGFTQARKWNPTMDDVLRLNERTTLEKLRAKRLEDTRAEQATGNASVEDTQYLDFLEAKAAQPKEKGPSQPLTDLSLSVIPRHLAEVIHYITYDEKVREMNALLENEDLRATVQSVMGSEGLLQLDGWVRDLAAGRMFDQHGVARYAEELADTWKGKVVMNALGYALGVPLGDVANLTTAVASGQVSAGNMGATTAGVMGRIVNLVNPNLLKDSANKDYASIRDFALLNSQELRIRTNRLPELLRAELAHAISGKFVPKVEFWLRQHAWATFDAMDRAMSTMIWTAAYNDKMEQLREADTTLSPNSPEAIKEAAKHADHVVQAVMPEQDILAKAAILRSKGSASALVVFYSWFSKVYNLEERIKDPYLDRMARTSSYGVKVRQGGEMAMRILGTMAAQQLVGEFFSGRGPTKDEEFGKWAARKMITAPLLNYPVIGQASETAIDAFVTGKPMSARSNPVGSYFQDMLKSVTTVITATDGTSTRNVEPEQAAAALVQMMMLGRGIPGGAQSRRSVEFWYKVQKGEEGRANPASGTVFGPSAGENQSILNPSPE